MATATYPGTGGFTAKTEADTFIPEIWSDEIIAAYQKNLKMVPLVRKLAMTGKKGDKLHIPKPVRGDANAKAADTAVTIIANTESELQIDITRHFEYSRLIEDIVEVQALSSLRQFYTEDAGMRCPYRLTMTFMQPVLALVTVVQLSLAQQLRTISTLAVSLTTMEQQLSTPMTLLCQQKTCLLMRFSAT